MPTLILTPRFTEDSQALGRAAARLGWDVERLRTWHVPEELRSVPEPVLYLEALFGPSLAEQFGLRMLEPAVDWLPRLPEHFRKRRVDLMTLREARSLAAPCFIKPPNDKSFPAQVYAPKDLPEGYDEEMPVLVAEVVTWEKEFRCFILDRKLRTLSIYLRGREVQRDSDFQATDAELSEASAFVQTVLDNEHVDLPRTAVLDVGVIEGRGWAVVEQNAAWGSGIYGCDPTEVLQVLRHASVPVGSVPTTDEFRQVR